MSYFTQTKTNCEEFSIELSNLIDTLVDERVGIIKGLTEKSFEADEFQTFIYNAHCCGPIYLNSAPKLPAPSFPDVHATGCDWTKESAMWATLGEALERYSAQCWQQFDRTRAKPIELGEKALPINDLVLFSEEQYQRDNFSWCRYDENQEIDWYIGESLHTGETKHIPASLLWMDYFLRAQSENFHPQISTGLACGEMESRVKQGGLREMIERDAFACHWCICAEAPAVELNDSLLSMLAPNIQSVIHNPNIEVNVRWITTEIDVPAIFVLLRSPYHEGTTVGAACHLNAAKAIDKAITEALHGWKWLVDLRRDSAPVDDPKSINDFKGHVKYYMNDDHVSNLAHYYNDKTISLDERYFPLEQSFEEDTLDLLRKLNLQGYEAFYADITPDDVRSLGFHVGKVIVPGLQPLASGWGNEHFDTKRLEKFARWKDIVELKLCHEPHPFP